MRVDPGSDAPIRLGITIHDTPLSADWTRLWLRLLAPLPSEVVPPPKEWPSAQVGQPGEGTEEESTSRSMNTAIVAPRQGARNG